MPAMQPDLAADDYYKVLGVGRDAPEPQITKAYKRLALRHHPDKNPGDRASEEAFKRISEAYSVLGAPEARRRYDRLGKSGAAAAWGEPPPSADLEKMFQQFFPGPGGGYPGMDSLLGGARRTTAAPGAMPSMVDGIFASFFGSAAPAGGGGAPGDLRRRKPADDAPCAAPVGTPVVIRGLAKRSEHNGKVGRVVSFDAARGRYDVRLEGGGLLAARPQNLTQQCAVEVVGEPGLGGQRGDIVSYDDRIGRYVVLMQDSSAAVSVPRQNCLLRVGTCIYLCELSMERFNGEMARITSVDRVASRYTVRCRSGEEIKVKLDKVVC